LGTDQTGPEKSGSVRLDIITAAAQELAEKPYNLVDLDDFLAQADVTELALPGFADPRRVDYLSGFLRRRDQE
jgi:hypothetical protein